MALERISEILHRIYAFVPTMLQHQLVACATLFAAGCVFFAIMREPGQGWSLGAVFRRTVAPDLYRTATARVDVWNTVLSYGIWVPLLRLTALFSTQALVFGWLQAEFGSPGLASMATGLEPIVQVAIITMIGELSHYWVHRAQHEIPLLWSFHRPHHSAEALTPFTSHRNHPVDTLLLTAGDLAGGAVIGALFYLLEAPASPALIAGFVAFQLFVAHFNLIAQHSHVPLSLGWFNRIVMTPVMHQLHHSAELHHRDRNYGSNFTVFDWMFGTLYLARPGERYRWGLNEHERGPDNPHNTVRSYYFEPFAYAWRTLRPRGGTEAQRRLAGASRPGLSKRP